VSRTVERDNSTATAAELDELAAEAATEAAPDLASLVAELAPPTHRDVPLRVDAQLAGVLDAGRRAAEAGVSWMERACAQFESIARIATDRAVQTERELVAALTGLADARAGELVDDDDDDAPQAGNASLDQALMGELLGALRGRGESVAESVAEPVAERDS
jgi:hypothetical protein